MSPVIKATTAGIPNIARLLTAVSVLPGSQNGAAVVNLTDINANILPPLPGQSKVGVQTLSVYDNDRYGNPLCEIGDVTGHGPCIQPREIRLSMLYVQAPWLFVCSASH